MDISVALGGGGAKGAAHIGVLSILEKHGYRIKALAGTSAGGIIGAFYAAGFSPGEILERFQKVERSSLYGRRPGDGPSLLGVSGINKVLTDMLGTLNFDELRIPFVVTAVDLITGQEVILREGRVVNAVLATMSLPGIFPHQEWDHYHLVDGGLLDPVPVAPARALAPHLPVVAVALSHMIQVDDPFLPPPKFLAPEPLLRQISRLRVAQAFSIFLRSVDIGSCALAELKLKIDQPEVLIRPRVTAIGLLDPVDVAEVAKLGEQAAEGAIPDLQAAFSWRARLQRRFRKSPVLPD
jgi:NTE family protein